MSKFSWNWNSLFKFWWKVYRIKEFFGENQITRLKQTFVCRFSLYLLISNWNMFLMFFVFFFFNGQKGSWRGMFLFSAFVRITQYKCDTIEGIINFKERQREKRCSFELLGWGPNIQPNYLHSVKYTNVYTINKICWLSDAFQRKQGTRIFNNHTFHFSIDASCEIKYV